MVISKIQYCCFPIHIVCQTPPLSYRVFTTLLDVNSLKEFTLLVDFGWLCGCAAEDKAGDESSLVIWEEFVLREIERTKSEIRRKGLNWPMELLWKHFIEPSFSFASFRMDSVGEEDGVEEAEEAEEE